MPCLNRKLCSQCEDELRNVPAMLSEAFTVGCKAHGFFRSRDEKQKVCPKCARERNRCERCGGEL